MGFVPREEEETSVKAMAGQLKQCGEVCMNCPEKIQPLPLDLSQWGAMCCCGGANRCHAY